MTLFGIDLHEFRKNVRPDFFLQIPVHHVTPVHRSPKVQLRHVFDGPDLVADVRTLFALRFRDAIQYDAVLGEGMNEYVW